MAKHISVTEELLAAPVAEMVRDLGLAVAEANKALIDVKTDIVYTIPEAEVSLKVALSMDQSQSSSVEGGLSIKMFNVNASYAKTFGFKEEASSSINLKLKAVPQRAGTAKKQAVKK